MSRLHKLRKQLQTEVDTAYLYEVLATKEKNEDLKDILHQMARIELRHARNMLKLIREESGRDLSLPPPSRRVKLKVKLAEWIGYDFILSDLLTLERDLSQAVITEKLKKGKPLDGMEANHLRILDNVSLKSGLTGDSLIKLEGRHKSVGGNALRAAVLGANDGLVSNMSLIMGVAGAIQSNREIVITGFAGLLAGAISMALGEWLSVRNSQELFDRQVAIELEELEMSPEEEMLELALIYQAKGIEKNKAEEMAREVFKDKKVALNTLVKEELGFDPDERKDSAWEAAITSFLLFTAGAIIPLIPFLITSGRSAIIWSMVCSVLGLFAIGAIITLFTGKSVWFSGMRQVVFGLVAAGITYGIGRWIGVSVLG